MCSRQGGQADLGTADEESMRRMRGNDIAMVFQEPMTAQSGLHDRRADRRADPHPYG
jgi:ABC-type microcin C transport system duplicated ATPase subunit YejF